MSRVSISTDTLLPPAAACALQQHPRYGAAVRAMGGTVVQLRHEAASALIVQRKLGPVTLSWLPRGPVTTADVHPSMLFDGLPRGLMSVIPERAETVQDFRNAGFRALLTPQHVAELDLTPSASARFAAQHGKWRNRLRRAQDGPLRITHRGFDAGRDIPLLDREQAQRKTRGYTALPRAFTLAYAATSPDAARLFLAQNGTDPAGFILLLLHPPVATYHIGWTAPDGRRYGAHPQLLWTASNWLANAGFTRLDLGSLDTEHAPDLGRFKLGFGARARSLGPTMLRLPRLTRPRCHV